MLKRRSGIPAQDTRSVSSISLYAHMKPFALAAALTALCVIGLVALIARYHHDTCDTVLQAATERFFDDVCGSHTSHAPMPAQQAEGD